MSRVTPSVSATTIATSASGWFFAAMDSCRASPETATGSLPSSERRLLGVSADHHPVRDAARRDVGMGIGVGRREQVDGERQRLGILPDFVVDEHARRQRLQDRLERR